MPLVVEHGIEYRLEEKLIIVYYLPWKDGVVEKRKVYEYDQTNPQRALAECLLKVLEAKDG